MPFVGIWELLECYLGVISQEPRGDLPFWTVQERAAAEFCFLCPEQNNLMPAYPKQGLIICKETEGCLFWPLPTTGF